MLTPLWGLIIGWILTVVIVTGNGLVIFLITTRRNLRTTTNWFVLSLAVADFGVGAISFPVLRLISESFTQEYVEVIPPLIGGFFIFASVTNLCALTLDRYVAIVKPLRYVTFMMKKRVALLIIAAWSVASLILSPLLVIKLDTSSKHSETIERILWLYIAVLYLFVCFTLLFATARVFLIVRSIARQNAAVVAQLNFNHRIQPRVTFKAQGTASAKMVGVVVIIFVICYLLDAVHGVCGLLFSQNETLGVLIELLRLMNSAVNPVAYFFFKRKIRKELKRLLCCRKY